MKLRGIVLIFIFCGLFFTLRAQVGVEMWIHNEDMNPIRVNNNTDISGPALSSAHVGISYEYALENIRIQFYPSLFLGASLEKTTLVDNIELEQQFIGVALPVRFYLLDIEGDCNCPTFGKSSNFFSKGFFFETAGFYQAVNQSLNVSGGDLGLSTYGASIGMGLDVGLSDNWTLTAFARLGQWFVPSVSSEGVEELSFDDGGTNFYHLGLSLRYYWTKYY